MATTPQTLGQIFSCLFYPMRSQTEALINTPLFDLPPEILVVESFALVFQINLSSSDDVEPSCDITRQLVIMHRNHPLVR